MRRLLAPAPAVTGDEIEVAQDGVTEQAAAAHPPLFYRLRSASHLPPCRMLYAEYGRHAMHPERLSGSRCSPASANVRCQDASCALPSFPRTGVGDFRLRQARCAGLLRARDYRFNAPCSRSWTVLSLRLSIQQARRKSQTTGSKKISVAPKTQNHLSQPQECFRGRNADGIIETLRSACRPPKDHV